MNTDWVTVKDLNETNAVYDRPIPSTFTGVIRYGSYDYKVNTYDANKLLLATQTLNAVADGN